MNGLVKWCVEEITAMKQQMEWMEKGQVKVHKYEGNIQLNSDENQCWIAHYKQKIAEMENIVKSYTLNS